MKNTPVKWIHLTDTHLIDGPELFGLNPASRLQVAVDSINKNFSDADLCMVSGDLTHFGERRAFKNFKKIMDQMAIPWYPMLGNHDDRGHFSSVFKEFVSPQNGFVNFTINTTQGRIIALDTLAPKTASGVLCRTRLTWLEHELAAARDAGDAVYIFMHHAPIDVGVDAMDAIKLENVEDFADVVQQYECIRHIFFGHLHRPCHGSWRGIPFSTVYGTAHQTALKLESGTPLYSSHEDPAYAVILINADDVVIHNYSFLQEDRSFLYDFSIKPKGGRLGL